MSKLRNIGSKCPSRALTDAVAGSDARAPVGDPFAVAAIAHSLGGGLVPEIAAGRPGDFIERTLGGIRDCGGRRDSRAARSARRNPWHMLPSTIRGRRR